MYWDEVIKQKTLDNISYDGWLDKYLVGKVSPSTNIIELRCGWGDDTSFLHKLGCNLISCDGSIEAVKFINKYLPQVETRQFDLISSFPFDNEAADYIVADLCLHYFDNEEMNAILHEVHRVLKGDGTLYVRINSINDINYGAGQGVLISEGLYLSEKGKKRFFDKNSVEEVFQSFNIISIEEVIITKYGKPKMAWEIVLTK